MKIKALENKDKSFDNRINTKNNILNNIVISVFLVGPGALIIMIVCMNALVLVYAVVAA